MTGALTIPMKSWQGADWQRLWLSIWTPKRPWRSLALVPAGPGTPPKTFMHIAMTLAHAGRVYLKTPIHVADASGIIQTAEHGPFTAELERYMRDDDKILIALPPLVDDNAVSLSVARAADCALLCIVRGGMTRQHAKKTLAQVGTAHFIGSALFHVDHETE